MGTDKGVDKDNSSLADMNVTLMGIEGELALRALTRSRDELEGAYDFINDAADAGVIDIDCDGCEGEGGEGAEVSEE